MGKKKIFDTKAQDKRKKLFLQMINDEVSN